MAYSTFSSLSSESTLLPGKKVLHPPSLFLVTREYYMDPNHLARSVSPRRDVFCEERVSYLDPNRFSDRRQHPSSSPLPQREWSAPSSPNRSSRRLGIEQPHRHDNQRPTSDQYVYMPPSGSVAQGHHSDSSYRQRGRKRRIRELLFGRRSEPEEEFRAIDVSRLYPQMSPYDDRSSVYSAPDELQHPDERFFDEASSSTYAPPSSLGDPSPVSLPRSPTYPPSTRNRFYNSAIDDLALADAEDYHLFVQATVGLGLEDSASQTESEPSPMSWRGSGLFESRITIPASTADSPVSPLEEASMTIRAMRHLAQIPDGSQITFSDSNVNAQPARLPIAPVRLTLQDFEDFNDDLPDYEASQTEAWSTRRAEATRRAQELQMRWRLSGARRGIM